MPMAYQVPVVALLGLVFVIRVIVNVYDRPSPGRPLDDRGSQARRG